MFSHLNAAERRLYIVLCANFIVLGISMTIFGATVPQIINGFHWSYLETGLVLAAGSVGGLISSFACGILLKHFRLRLLVALGLGLTALALCFVVRSPLSWVNCLLNFAIGIGSGFSEVITNSLVVRLERQGESRLMNLMHAFFCVGAVAGPGLVFGITVLDFGYVNAYLIAGIIQALVGLLLLLQNFPAMGKSPGLAPSAVPGELQEAIPARQPGETAAPPALARLLRSPLLLAGAFTLFLYVGVELAMSNWVAEYFVRFRAMDAALAALIVSVYWLGLLAGRLGLSFFYKGKRQEYMLALLAISSVACFASVVLLPNPPLATIAVFLTGLAFSGIYPIAMSLVGTWFPGSTTALGFCSAAGGAGVLLFPLLIAGMAQTIGLSQALLTCTIFDLLLAVTAGVLMARRWRRERNLSAQA